MNKATVQQHHICVAVSPARLAVIGQLMCNSTLRRPLPSICGSSEAALLNGCHPRAAGNFGSSGKLL
jgi:hypothetical protein